MHGGFQGPQFAQPGFPGGAFAGPGPEMGWAVDLFQLVAFALLIGVAIFIIWMVMHRSHGHVTAPGSMNSSTAVAELDLRYARGEIDHNDYLKRRNNILGIAAPPTPDK